MTGGGEERRIRTQRPGKERKPKTQDLKLLILLSSPPPVFIF
jgi:hypothetical protein